MTLFIDRKVDAFLANPPDTLELRARGIGHSLVNSNTDRVRAFVKAIDLCVSEPERVARVMVDRGFTDRYDYALQTLQELPYGAWCDHDARTRYAFLHCGCMKRASSSQTRSG
jgi:NitT/TauT family transport system substrate-binding protein